MLPAYRGGNIRPRIYTRFAVVSLRTPTRRTTLFTLANALLWPALATALDYGLDLQDKPGASVAYVLAVALSTYLGGVASGVVAALLSFLALSFFFVGAPRAFELQSENVSGLALFLFAAAGIGYLLVRERQAKDRADALLEESGRLLARFTASEERLASVIESSLDGIVVIDETGAIQIFNPASEQLFGYRADEVTGRNVSMLMPEPFAGEHAGYLERYLRTGEPHAIGIRRELEGLRKDGTTFPFDLSLNEARVDGRRLFTGVLHDLTDRRRYDAERDRRLEQERFLAQAGVSLAKSLDYEETLGEIARLAVPMLSDWCTIDLLDDGRIENVADAHADPGLVHARSLHELFPPDPESSTGVPNVLRTGRSELYAEIDADMLDAVPDEELRSIVRDLELRSAMIVPLAARGRVLGVISFFLAESGRRYGDQDLRFAEELARHAALAIDNGRLHRAEQDARAALQVVAERLDRLHRVAAALAKAVTVPDALNVILGEGIAASGAVAGLVGLVSEDGETIEVAASRGYPDRTIRAWRSFPLSRRLPLSDAVRTGRAFFCESQAERDAHWPTFAGVGASHAFVALPLAVRGTVQGAVALTFADDRAFSREERELLLTIASQCAQAFERARLYEQEHAIAVAVQRSLLPREVAVSDEVAVAVRYLPASPGLEIGGDWYDVMRLGPRELMIAIGDVVGHGLQAAATMGQLRNATRAYALESSSTSEIVSRLNAFVSRFQDGEFSTLFVGRIDLERRVLEYTNAGHPPPLLRRPDGETVWLDEARAFPIGVEEGSPCPSATVELEPGTLLFMYTDGLVERRTRSLEEGLAALQTVIEESADDPETLVEEVIDGVVDDAAEHADDIAMLTFRFLPEPGLQLRLERDPEQAGELRARLQDWLEQMGATPDENFDVTLACSEAFANAIEHPLGAADSSIDVEGAVSNGELTITVRDYGGWREHRLREEGGLGLPLMNSLMSAVDVKRRPEGTTVVLRRRLGSALAA
jgi:PAS domain S-box-containing protein